MHLYRTDRFIFVAYFWSFSGSLLFSRVALLKLFTKSSKFSVGFDNNELF